MPLSDDGYIKYTSTWNKLSSINTAFDQLITIRNQLAAINLIGVYPDNIGFGNISERVGDTNAFIISGTQTGNIPICTQHHFSLVTSADISANTIICEGPVQASSEALTHAAIYQIDPSIKAVIHIHHQKMWKALLHKAPTIGKLIPYGTPAMALAMQEQLTWIKKNGDPQIIVTAGHEDGIFTYGEDLSVALSTLMHFFKLNK